MTKTLTEQWKDETLAEGDYYIRVVPHLLGKEIIVPCYCSGRHCDGYQEKEVKEILAPVPSYDKVKEMIDGDKETIRHLKKILPTIKDKVNYDYLATVIEDFEKALKEMEGVK